MDKQLEHTIVERTAELKRLYNPSYAGYVKDRMETIVSRLMSEFKITKQEAEHYYYFE